MGNGLAKLTPCCTGGAVDVDRRRRHLSAAVISDPYDDSLGHSFCYVRRDPLTSAVVTAASSKVHDYAEESTTFRSISGASLGANPATPLSTSLIFFNEMTCPASAAAAAAAFESSDSFAAVPLQPIPRFSGPLSGGSLQDSRGFLSGPIERGFMSGPLDGVVKSAAVTTAAFSGPLRRSLSVRSPRRAATRFFSVIKRAMLRRPKYYGESSTSSSAAEGGAAGEEPELPPPPLQWAQGKAGEDRVHVVVSEEHGWMFVGIYDGFNGPDATDYLLSNLYLAVNQELKGLLWDDENASAGNESVAAVNHGQVLKALSRALEKTEEAYLDMADQMIAENHSELALMGSCVLVMLMKGDDVYLMNVGDSRAILAHKSEENSKEDISKGVEDFGGITQLSALQITLDHSTSIEEEVRRIRNEHPEDSCAIANDRVKGSLKVTRAFGAGYLKQPKWNNALLEMFRIDYVGTAPYLSCSPFLYHHRLGPNDRFLILSSDGLYQYFTNEEAVTQVELFIEASPEGDPAQHLVEEVLFRAARKAGMDFHELLEIPQGDRRRYHDDVSIIVISLEGRIWRSCV